MSRGNKSLKVDDSTAAKLAAYAAHMAAQRAGKLDEAPPQHEEARRLALASKLDGLGRERIVVYLKAGATVEKSAVEWRATLLLRDGRFLSVFRHHLEQVQNEGYA